MTDEELLKRVKTALNITGDYQNETLKVYIAEVKRFLLDSGVSEETIKSEKCVGAVARGVADLWGGEKSFSEYFCQCATQLRYEVSGDV